MKYFTYMYVDFDVYSLSITEQYKGFPADCLVGCTRIVCRSDFLRCLQRKHDSPFYRIISLFMSL